MILRVFRARLKPGARQAFEKLCYDVSIPLLRAQPGLVALHVGRPLPEYPDEFVLVTVWTISKASKDSRAIPGIIR